MKKTSIAALSFMAIWNANAIELTPCSFPGESGAMAPRCVKQTIEGHSVEIAKLPPFSDIYVVKVDDREAKRFRFGDYQINRGWPVPFLANAETLVLADRDSLSFYGIPSIFKVEEGASLNLKEKDRISSFFLSDGSIGLSAKSADQFAAIFEVDSGGVFLGKEGDGPRIAINYKVDPQWVDTEYRKLALLDAAETRYVMWGKFNCEYSYRKRPKKQQRCLKDAKDHYDLAVAAIKAGKPQNFVGPGLEETSLGQFYTSPADGAQYSLGVVVNGIGTPASSVNGSFLMIRHPGGGRNARLDLERSNPYLRLVP